MNTQGKTVSALESKKKSLLSHIDQLEISVGRQVLQASAPMVEQQLSVDYAAAAGTKQQLLRNIAELYKFKLFFGKGRFSCGRKQRKGFCYRTLCFS